MISQNKKSFFRIALFSQTSFLRGNSIFNESTKIVDLNITQKSYRQPFSVQKINIELYVKAWNAYINEWLLPVKWRRSWRKLHLTYRLQRRRPSYVHRNRQLFRFDDRWRTLSLPTKNTTEFMFQNICSTLSLNTALQSNLSEVTLFRVWNEVAKNNTNFHSRNMRW